MKLIKIFSTNVRNRRYQLELTQEKLAELSDLSRTYICDLERCQRSISLNNIEKIANALGVKPYLLFIEDSFDNTKGGIDMPVANKEFILNYATNRWQLNFKRNVGELSDNIRLCSPKSVEEWEKYYFTNMYPKSHLDDLGQKLYDNISNILPDEKRFHPDLLDSISLDDCKNYIYQLVIYKTFDGYIREHGK